MLAYNYEVMKNRKFERKRPSRDGRNGQDSSRKICPERLAAQSPPITLRLDYFSKEFRFLLVIKAFESCECRAWEVSR